MSLVDFVLSPIEPHTPSFGPFLWMLEFTIPYAEDLYICIGVACRGWPIYSRVTLIGLPDLALWNNPPNYASAADEITFFMMFERVRTEPLDSLVLLKLCDPKKKCSSTRLLA